MSAKEKWLWGYKVIRSILFTAIILIGTLFAGLYVLLSIPAVQDKIRVVAVSEISNFIGSRVEIGNLNILPFNEIIISDLDVFTPDNSVKCLHADKVGAGVSIWNLIINRKIVITYAELIGLDGDIRQKNEGDQLNIQFIIDAFAPKDPNKPPAKFDLDIRNIVIRKSSISFNREWLPVNASGIVDFNHLILTGLNADVALPTLSNDRIEIDLRRLALIISSSVEIKRLSFLAVIDHGDISVNDFNLIFPNSRIKISDLYLPLSEHEGKFKKMLSDETFSASINAEHLVPADFAGLVPKLSGLQTPFTLDIQASGNAEKVILDHLELINRYEDFNLRIDDLTAFKHNDNLLDNIVLSKAELKMGTSALQTLASVFGDKLQPKLQRIIASAGSLDIEMSGRGSLSDKLADGTVKLLTGFGDLDIDGSFVDTDNVMHIKANATTSGIDAGKLLDNQELGNFVFSLDGNVSLDKHLIAKGKSTGLEFIDRINAMLPEGMLNLDIAEAFIKGNTIREVEIHSIKTTSAADLSIVSHDPEYIFQAEGEIIPSGGATKTSFHADFDHIDPGSFITGIFSGYAFNGKLDLDITGNNPDNIVGNILLTDFMASPHIKDKRSLKLDRLEFTSEFSQASGSRSYFLNSDWFDAQVIGQFNPLHLIGDVKKIIGDVLTNGVGEIEETTVSQLQVADNLTYSLTVYPGGSWAEFFNLPLKLLYNANINGSIDCRENMLTLNFDAPYVQQGRDKLIRNSKLNACIKNGKGSASLYSSIPTKKGVLDLGADVMANERHVEVNLGFNKEKQGAFFGDLKLGADFKEDPLTGSRIIEGKFYPTKLWLNNAAWDINESDIKYIPGLIEINNFAVRHGDQYVTISGEASSDSQKEILVGLSGIDLNYIFDTLNIEYVQFGGLATGEAVGRALLSRNPEAFTRNLYVKDLSYNNSVLGNGEVSGNFDAPSKRIGIKADISEDGRRVALVDGGIWLGKDSLSFDLDAEKVRIGFLQSFMKAFSSHVEGRASGNAKLYGTFKDIDLKGRLFADNISVKVDYTNVTYNGSDSVNIVPGKITIPAFKLFDSYGNSAILQGTLTHHFFHEPSFRFTVRDARDLLVYDTDASMNAIWYGRIFGSGSGEINGFPGYVGIMADMTTRPGSAFTFVLSDEQEATEYKFLQFTDKRKEEQERTLRAMREKEGDKEIDADAFVAAFNKKLASETAEETTVAMDLRATVTPAAKLTMIMDPIAGDKITAYGSGAMNMTYNSESNDLKLYGKYTLQEGAYNFSLQDLILKDFTIKPGSSIAFNGDPMNGMLDIKAAYRVNTNLTDLDKSFATDRDLNRTNVPVDATLIVNGEMTHPDISFDVEFPTLNDEVTQKVRSIISSEDMMSRQIIYLLALNRFYTPEYMGTSSSGGEWASVATSTISSQLSNILGQLTDKVNIMPSLRSEKGDFSDLEVDLALSSRLFNNRLWINGNLGYRDRTNSSTTFIGDFDIEYLLNRNGNFRLKAYNHFNDQNYYLKSALTTQGIGVIFRKDFDRLFRRKRKLVEKK